MTRAARVVRAGSFLAAALLAALAPAAPARADVLKVGAPYPDLNLPTIDGTSTLRVSDLRGTWVLLIEFASW